MKAIFNRAPLPHNTMTALPVGSIRPEGWLLAQVQCSAAALALATPAENGVEEMRRLQARILLAWQLGDDAEKAECTAQANSLGKQLIEGELPVLTLAQALKALRYYFMASGDKEILRAFDASMKKLYHRIGQTPMREAEVSRGAEILEAVLWLYNLTGQKYLMDLAWKIYAQTLDWSDAFHSFRVKNAMSRTTQYARLEEGIREEAAEGNVLEGANRPYFGTLKRISCGEDVAYGLKAPGVFDCIKSGFKEKSGFANGWNHLVESHGLANGMFSCDTHLNGRNPVQGTSLAAIVQTLDSMQSLMNMGEYDGAVKIADAWEKIAYNALPAAFNVDMTRQQPLQQVNQVCVSEEVAPWYAPVEGGNGFVSSDCGFEAWAAFTASLWSATDDGGVAAQSYAPCSVRFGANGVPVRLTVSGGYPFAGNVRIEVSVKQPVEFGLYLRIPFWARQPMIYLPDGEIMQVKSGEMTCVRRRWTSGDVLTLELPMAPRVTRWYLQSAAVELGPLLMVCHPEEEDRGDAVMTSAPWNWAFYADEPMKSVEPQRERVTPFHISNGGTGVLVKAARVPWSQKQDSEGYTVGVAGRVPMGAQPDKETCVLKLVPYGDTTLRIAQFPTVQ